METLNIIKDIVTIIAALATVTIAALGLYTWKRQLKGTKRFDIALEAMLETRLLQDSIAFFRAPFISAGEAIDVFKEQEGKDPDFLNREENDKANDYAMAARWRSISAAYRKYEHSMLQAEILLREPQLKPENRRALRDRIIDLQIQFENHRRLTAMVKRSGSEENGRHLYQQLEEAGKTVYSSHTPDLFGESLKEAFTPIFSALERHLQ